MEGEGGNENCEEKEEREELAGREKGEGEGGGER